MEKLKVLDLFSGIGGFSLGVERTGDFETVAFVEIDPFCQKILAKHWPKVKVFNDVTNFRYKENVDLVTAGFPCQDISYAGPGSGLEGERSGLFWYIIRTLRMVGRPKLLLENVAGLLTRGIGSVLGALATFGYDTEWHCIPASYVGARHERDRIWIIADPQCERQPKQRRYIDAFSATPHENREADRIIDHVQRTAMPYVCGEHNAISDGMDRCKALGNAVVPQIPEIIGHAILATQQTTEPRGK